MADQPYDADLENSQNEKADQIFDKLKTKQITTVAEVEQALNDENPQARFHRQIKLLLDLITCDTASFVQVLLRGANIFSTIRDKD